MRIMLLISLLILGAIPCPGALYGQSGETILYNNNPAWSPTSNQLAYVSNISGNSDIWMVDLDTAQTTNLTQDMDTSEEFGPKWSPTGTHLAFLSAEGYTSGSPQWSAWYIDLQSGTRMQLTDEQLDNISKLAWSPSGEYVAYSTNLDIPNTDTQMNIIHIGSGEHITFDDIPVASYNWSSNGNLIMSAQMTDQNGGYRINDGFWQYDIKTGEITRLVSGLGAGLVITDFEIIDDGLTIIACVFRALASSSLWLIDILSQTVIQSLDFSVVAGLAVSPDGTRAAFHVLMGDDLLGEYDIFLLNIEDLTFTNLTNGKLFRSLWPSWSPDGTLIAFTGYPSAETQNRDDILGESDIFIIELKDLSIWKAICNPDWSRCWLRMKQAV